MVRTSFIGLLAVALIAVTPPSPTASPAPVYGIDKARFRANAEAPALYLPTPPPAVLARTKFIYEVNIPNEKRWGPLGLLPEERYVRMYVTSISRFGPMRICHGWSVRVPMAGAPIVDAHETGICQGSLQPFAGGSPPPVPKSVEP